jgi:hypothetical protein
MDPLLWLVHGPTLSSLMSPPSPPSCSVLSSNSDRDTKSDLDPLCFMLQYISVQALANHCRTRTRHSPVRCTSCCVDPFSTLLVCHPQAVQGASCTRPQTLHDMSCTGRAGFSLQASETRTECHRFAGDCQHLRVLVLSPAHCDIDPG